MANHTAHCGAAQCARRAAAGQDGATDSPDARTHGGFFSCCVIPAQAVMNRPTRTSRAVLVVRINLLRWTKVKDLCTKVCGPRHTDGEGCPIRRCLFYNSHMLQYQTIPVTPFEQNCSLIWDDQSRQAAVVDPGGDLDLILDVVRRNGLKLEQIWITHGHLDHASGTADLAEQMGGLPIIGPHPADQFWIDGLPQAAAAYGFPPARVFHPTRWLADGDTVSLGAHTLQVRHCPGHTPGHVVFYSPEIKRAFVGDVLFAGSIGRTDFPQGNHDDLIASITQRLWPMGHDTVFIPGHGPESTFGRERQSNPYVRDK